MTATLNHLSELTEVRSGYAPSNGLDMYYEIKGSGKPLIYLPSILGYAGQTDFPSLQENRTVITVDLQGWGRTRDIDRAWSIENSAADVVALMNHLGIAKADFFGYSIGGIIATYLAAKFPEVVDRVAAFGAFYGNLIESTKPISADALTSLTPDGFAMTFIREGYKKVSPTPEYWPTICQKVFTFDWNGFTAAELASIEAPFLLAVGDHDFIRLDHCVSAYGQIPNADFAVIADAGHFVVFDEPEKLMPVVEKFLDAPAVKVPFGTTATGYHAGQYR